MPIIEKHYGSATFDAETNATFESQALNNQTCDESIGTIVANLNTQSVQLIVAEQKEITETLNNIANIELDLHSEYDIHGLSTLTEEYMEKSMFKYITSTLLHFSEFTEM